MSKKNQSLKAFLPALGLVFGAGAGALIAVVYGFRIAFGIVIGAAAGLLIGLVFSHLYQGRNKPQDGDDA